MKREESIERITDVMRLTREAWEKYGGLMTQGQTARLTKLSRQRIHQLIDQGVFFRVQIVYQGDIVGDYIAGHSVEYWLRQNPCGGAFRPQRVLAFA